MVMIAHDRESGLGGRQQGIRSTMSMGNIGTTGVRGREPSANVVTSNHVVKVKRGTRRLVCLSIRVTRRHEPSDR